MKDKNNLAAFADYKASDDAGTAGAPGAAVASPPPPPPPKAPKQPEQPKSAPPPAPPAPQPAQQTQESPVPSKKSADTGRVFATPLARNLAAERNIDISVGFHIFFDKRIDVT